MAKYIWFGGVFDMKRFEHHWYSSLGFSENYLEGIWRNYTSRDRSQSTLHSLIPSKKLRYRWCVYFISGLTGLVHVTHTSTHTHTHRDSCPSSESISFISVREGLCLFVCLHISLFINGPRMAGASVTKNTHTKLAIVLQMEQRRRGNISKHSRTLCWKESMLDDRGGALLLVREQ